MTGPQLVTLMVTFMVGFVVGILVSVDLAAKRTHGTLPKPTRPAPPMPGVEPSAPWPEESLFDRHVRHAVGALTDREMNTDASIEDALGSAERFIHHARRTIAQKETA